MPDHIAPCAFRHLGVRYAQAAWSAEGAIASRTSGGRPQSDSRDFNPAFWASVAYRF
jgi:hypothetical protein